MKVFGTLRLEKRKWRITAEPHVIIRAKRVFAGISKDDDGVLLVGDTVANCRDLLWFLDRFPLDVEPGRLERLKTRSAEQCEREDLVGALLEGVVPPQPFELAKPARDYQRLTAQLALASHGTLDGSELGVGKQQPVDAPVLTPSGYRPIGSLRVGDLVIGSAGKPVRVLGVFPQGVKPSYRVRFNDGSSAEAGPEHLWSVDYFAAGRGVHRRLTLTTEQLRTRPVVEHLTTANQYGSRVTRKNLARTQLYVPMLSAPAEFDVLAAELPVAPYLLGQLIANGYLAGGTPALTVNTLDWAFIRTELLAENDVVGAVQVYGGATRVGMPGILRSIRALGLDVLSGAKRIPRAYLMASPADRIALLQGLMDGDGSCSATRCRVHYHTINQWLAADVVELIQGLGGVAAINPQDRSHHGKPTEYTVRVRLPESIPPFRVPRKASRYHPSQRKNPTRSLVSVDYVRDVESVCISVDAPDRLYVTENAILTHNTVTGICFLSDPRTRPALVCCPTHLQRQWVEKIAEFAPHLTTHVLRQGTPYDYINRRQRKGLKLPVPGAHPDVLITSYGKLAGWVETLSPILKGVIFEEVHELRSGPLRGSGENKKGSEKGSAAQQLANAVQYRLGLSGTPIFNYGGEIYWVLQALKPWALGTVDEFRKEWCVGAGDKAALEDPAAFGSFLRTQGLMVRHTRKDVSREIPDLTKIVHPVESDPAALEAIRSSATELARIILNQAGRELSKGEQMRAGGELDARIRQATGLAKAPYVVEFVKLLLESEQKILLSGWHRDVYDVWLDGLKEYSPVLYTGSESPTQKEASKKAFCEGESRVMIMSLRSGSGLDGLQFSGCKTVVHGELDWAYAVHEQVTGRLHRDGQPEPVLSVYLISDSGSDPIVADILGVKREQLDGIRNPFGQGTVEHIDTGAHIKRLAEELLKKRAA